MMRRLYAWLIQHHPPVFRDRFGDEMLAVYDEAVDGRGGWSLVASATASLIKQWLRHTVAAPRLDGVSEAAATALREHSRYLTLQQHMANRILLLMSFAFAVDAKVWMTSPLLLMAVARASWLVATRRRRQRTYLRRLLEDRSFVRCDAQRRLDAIHHAGRSRSLLIAAIWGVMGVGNLLSDYRRQAGPSWGVDLAFVVIFLLVSVNRRQEAAALTREIGAIDEMTDHQTGPLGLGP